MYAIYYSIITGIYNEWFAKTVEEEKIDVSRNVLFQAGLIIAKTVYRITHDREYPLDFIRGGVRGLHYFTEMVGGDVCITMNWEGQADQLLKMDLPVVARLFNSIQENVLDVLLEKGAT